MSEKDWNVVLRNKNLLSAHRLVFSNLGQMIDGTKAVKFRRIERAPYSGKWPFLSRYLVVRAFLTPLLAFVLKPRKFALHEIPGADVKVEVCFRNPGITAQC
jgi:hypothetical protein